jgi:ketosteroid isomerase-like protein
MPSPSELSRQYIAAFNAGDLDTLIALVDDSVDFKRPDEERLFGQIAVRAQYEEDWATHKSVHVHVVRLFESGSTALAEIEVDAGPPSQEWYRGVVIHDWNVEGRLVRYRLYFGDTERPDATD